MSVPSDPESHPFGTTLEDLRAILSNLPLHIVIVDKEGMVLFINSEIASARRFLGRSIFELSLPEYRDPIRRTFDEVLRTGQPGRCECRGIYDGGATWYELHIGPLRRGDEIVALTVAAALITDRKRLEEDQRTSVERLKHYADELEEKNRLLEAENAERERAEAALRAHEEVIRSLSTPIIQAWEGVLALPIIGSLDRERAAQLMERLLEEIVRSQSRFAVLDLTGVDVVDTSTVEHLLNVMRAVSLLGSRCLVSGISPAIAQTVVSLGSSMEGLLTFGQMQDALRYALLESGVRDVRKAARRPNS